AGAQAREQQIVGRGPRVAAAAGGRLVGRQRVLAGGHAHRIRCDADSRSHDRHGATLAKLVRKELTMKCPRCKTPDLKPTLIEEYLPAMGCDTCHGSFVSLLYYRHWAETQKLAAPEHVPAETGPVATSDSTSALI